MKKLNVPDTMIPTVRFAVAKNKDGLPIRYFGIPTVVDVSPKKEKFTTASGMMSKKFINLVWLAAPAMVSDETAAWMKNIIGIDTEGECDVQHALIVVDEALLKFHFSGLSKKETRQVIAFYSAKAMIDDPRGDKVLKDYMKSTAPGAEHIIEEISDKEITEYLAEGDVLLEELLIAARAVGSKPSHVLASVQKNEKKIGKYGDELDKFVTKANKKGNPVIPKNPVSDEDVEEKKEE